MSRRGRDADTHEPPFGDDLFWGAPPDEHARRVTRQMGMVNWRGAAPLLLIAVLFLVLVTLVGTALSR